MKLKIERRIYPSLTVMGARSRFLFTPFPCIPYSQHVEHQSHDNQKLVIEGRVGRQSDEIEDKEDHGRDDGYPANRGIPQRQG